MGREIRRVPPNWEHPKNNKGNYLPLYDTDFDTAMTEWMAGYQLWQKGEHPDQAKYESAKNYTFQDWSGAPPDPDYYRPKFSDEPTWYQAYETVSEGTPITPPFETPGELSDYLVNHGDFWGYKWDRKAADSFVKSEYAPSLILGPDGLKRPSDEGFYPEGV